MQMQRTLRATFRRLPGSARGASSLVYVGGYTEKMYYSPTAFHPGGGGGVYGMSLDHDTPLGYRFIKRKKTQNSRTKYNTARKAPRRWRPGQPS